MFRCGDYYLTHGELVDFGDLIIPCKERIGVSILESDPFFNDGMTVLIPCEPQEKDYDLLIRASRDYMKTTQTIADVT